MIKGISFSFDFHKEFMLFCGNGDFKHLFLFFLVNYVKDNE